MLAACRNPSSKIMWAMDGSSSYSSDDEFLNIQPLGAAWRQAVTKATPPREVIFDLTLPKEEASTEGDASTNRSEGVYWSHALPPQGGLAIRILDVITLAVTLATNIKMRTAADLKFSVITKEPESIQPESMEKLEMQLLALANFKRRAPGKDKDKTEGSSADPKA